MHRDWTTPFWQITLTFFELTVPHFVVAGPSSVGRSKPHMPLGRLSGRLWCVTHRTQQHPFQKLSQLPLISKPSPCIAPMFVQAYHVDEWPIQNAFQRMWKVHTNILNRWVKTKMIPGNSLYPSIHPSNWPHSTISMLVSFCSVFLSADPPWNKCVLQINVLSRTMNTLCLSISVWVGNSMGFWAGLSTSQSKNQLLGPFSPKPCQTVYPAMPLWRSKQISHLEAAAQPRKSTALIVQE